MTARAKRVSDTPPRFTITVAAVMDHVIRNPKTSGYEILTATGLFTGTLYPILERLGKAGWIESQREEGDPSLLGRPLRIEHVATPKGVAEIKAQASRQHAIIERLAESRLDARPRSA